MIDGVFLGDFNSICCKEEKKGMGDFMEDLEVMNIFLVGQKFTWYTNDVSSHEQIGSFLGV